MPQQESSNSTVLSRVTFPGGTDVRRWRHLSARTDLTERRLVHAGEHGRRIWQPWRISVARIYCQFPHRRRPMHELQNRTQSVRRGMVGHSRRSRLCKDDLCQVRTGTNGTKFRRGRKTTLRRAPLDPQKLIRLHRWANAASPTLVENRRQLIRILTFSRREAFWLLHMHRNRRPRTVQ